MKVRVRCRPAVGVHSEPGFLKHSSRESDDLSPLTHVWHIERIILDLHILPEPEDPGDEAEEASASWTGSLLFGPLDDAVVTEEVFTLVEDTLNGDFVQANTAKKFLLTLVSLLHLIFG